MTRRARLSKYSRRTSSGGRRGGKVWLIILAVIAFLLLSVTVSVAVGIALGNRAEEYDDSLPPLDISVKDRYSGNKSVPTVDAQSFELKDDASYYLSIGIKTLSVCLRDEDGFIYYRSEVDVSFGENNKTGSRDLGAWVENVHGGGGYVCSYFYSSALNESDPYLREIKKSYELALINEAAHFGVDDILLVGIDVTRENIDEVEEFVSRAAKSAGEATLGVLLQTDDCETDKDDRTAQRIAAVSDYIAIDLRGMPGNSAAQPSSGETPPLYETLEELEYFIKVYSARIVFGKNNSGLANSARKWGVTSTQIIE